VLMVLGLVLATKWKLGLAPGQEQEV
jgi:hypothetical protein